MFKKTLVAIAAVVAVSGSAMALQAVPAQAAEGKVIEVGHRGHGWRHRHHRRCFVTYKRVRGYYGSRFKRVRICPPNHYRKHHRKHHHRHHRRHWY